MKFKLIIIFYLFAINGFSQFLEPGISIGVNSYSGDLKRGYSLSDGSMGLEIFNRFNISSHQTFKFSYKRGNLKGSERINDNLSSNRNMWFKAKFSEVSLKFEYNFLTTLMRSIEELYTISIYGARIYIVKKYIRKK